MNNIKLPLHCLPQVYGWHLMVRQSRTTGQKFRYFGSSWWDLLNSGDLDLSTHKVELDVKRIESVVFINLGSTPIIMRDDTTLDTYHIQGGGRSNVNNISDHHLSLSSNKSSTAIHVSRIGNVYILLLQVEWVQSQGIPKECSLYTDFLLMNGIPDANQYLTSTGIESFESINVSGYRIVDESTIMKSELAQLLIDHWDTTNMITVPKISRGIPKIIHWIWLGLSNNQRSGFGALRQRFYKFMDTWIARNPKFKFNIWTDNSNFTLPKKYVGTVNICGPHDISDLLGDLNPQICDEIKYLYRHHPNVGARSDTLRQAILFLRGGIYSDINDGSCLVSLGGICSSFNYIIGMEPVMYVNNAIVGSSPLHTFSKNMLVWLADNSRKFVSEWRRHYADASADDRDNYIVSTTGPIALTCVIAGAMSKDRYPGSLILPASYIYPNYWMPQSPENWLKPVSLTAHFDARDYLG